MKKTILVAFCLMGAIACSNELEYQNDNRTVLTLELPGTTKTVLGDAQDRVRRSFGAKETRFLSMGSLLKPSRLKKMFRQQVSCLKKNCLLHTQ